MFSIRCYDKVNNRWWDTKQSAAGDNLVGRRPSIAWHSLRRAATSPSAAAPPLNDDPTLGQFWVTVVMRDSEVGEWRDLVIISRGYSATLPPTRPPVGPVPLTWQPIGFIWDGWTRTVQRTAIPLFENGALSSMKGLYFSTRSDNDVPNDPSGVVLDKRVLLPFADGTFDANLSDTNDFVLFERGLCRGLWHPTWESGWPACG